MTILSYLSRLMKNPPKSGYIRNFLSAFFYRIARTITISKLRDHGRLIASTYDVCAVIVAWSLSCWLLIDAMIPVSKQMIADFLIWPIASNLIWILPLQFVLFRLFGLYRGFWRFASIQDLKKIILVSMLGGAIALNVMYINNHELLPYFSRLRWLSSTIVIFFPPYSTAFLYSVLLGTFLSSARLFIRFAKEYKHRYSDCQRVIIIGAGNAGEGLVRDLLRDGNHRYYPVAFLDDDLLKLGREIHNVRVIGIIAELPKFIDKYAIDLVLIAIPSASSASMRSVLDVCEKASVRCYTLPGIKDLANGRVSINVLRSVSLEDLLGRYPVSCQESSVMTQLRNKIILVTGGGGSIGSELCRQIASLDANISLVILESNEFNLYSIDMELRQKYPNCTLYPVLLNVTDRIGVQRVLKQHRPDMLFHAAAYKHVPLLEDQPSAGTQIVAEEAVKVGVKTFVLISSDKAVNPTNVMGATKRAAEYFCQNLNDENPTTRFITVRFGNVLGSAGSVIPLFQKQIESGGPVTVTHPEITRFFMTIPEASQLIMQAACLGQGGEIFVLDMGDPIKISYLAEKMITLAGKVADKDIKIIYTGLRPGEKLYEECFYSDEKLQSTENAKILRAQSQRRDFNEIQFIFDKLAALCQRADIDTKEIFNFLKKLVPEYQIQQNNVHEIVERAGVLEKY
jgi:FlaA1/EpsC-like NDP-sugar epimerase